MAESLAASNYKAICISSLDSLSTNFASWTGPA